MLQSGSRADVGSCFLIASKDEAKKCCKGQSAVEMAVFMPVMLAVVVIAVNLMVFLGDCARFDRIAAEAVRTQAASPGYAEYGVDQRAVAVNATIESSFAGHDNLGFSVSVAQTSLGGNQGSQNIGFSLLPTMETYTCEMRFTPLGFGSDVFGIRVGGISHTRSYSIDPYRPGVLF